MNILVCDDDREIVGAIEIYLKNEGYEVFKAYDGIEALDILRKEEIHLILMDIMMPEMNGIDVLKKIKDEMQETKVLLCTGAGSGSMVDLAMRLGADGYIVKPYDADRIHMGIQRALGLK